MGDVAAFFDLDRTILSANSGMLWAVAELRRSEISLSQFVRAAVWSTLYHLSVVNMDEVASVALRHYEGVDAEALERRIRHWYESDVAPLVRPAARAPLAHHPAHGHTLVLLTNASLFEGRVAVEHLELDALLATPLTVDETGRLTGGYDPPLCYGEGKVIRAEAWAAEQGVDLDRSWFYGDSLGDLPMLARVGHPRVVTPDPRLAREARRRGWPILAW